MVSRIERASRGADTATKALRDFLTAVVEDRNDMLLPTTGGPAVQSDRTRAVQARLHDAISRLIERGAEDGTIMRPVDVWDVAWLGATLAQPGRPEPSWDAVCLRLLDTYLAGLGVS